MLKHKYPFEALGTQWSIETGEEISTSLKQVIQEAIESFDATYSRFRKDSLITEISKAHGLYTFPDDASVLFDFYKSLYDLTDGKVTPLIGDMISRAGYDAEYSLKPRPQKPIPTWDEVLSWDGLVLTTSKPVILDFGAAGKGALVDIICALLDVHAINEYVVDASGDIRHKGASENKVGLEHPFDATKIIGMVDIQNKGICASASNRRAWGEGMHHIFDPDAMAPTNTIIATWVIADEAMIADGLATALFFAEPKKLKTKYDFEYVRIDSKGTVEYSPYFEGKLF